jgi:hypothetical protein
VGGFQILFVYVCVSGRVNYTRCKVGGPAAMRLSNSSCSAVLVGLNKLLRVTVGWRVRKVLFLTWNDHFRIKHVIYFVHDSRDMLCCNVYICLYS